MPTNPPQKPAAKLPTPPPSMKSTPAPNPISLGLLSLLVGSVALSLYSVPFLLVHILAVLTSLGGITLAILQFRKNEKGGRNVNSAIVGTIFCAAVLVLSAIGPYLPTPRPQATRPKARKDIPKVAVSPVQSPETPSPAAKETKETTQPAVTVLAEIPDATDKDEEKTSEVIPIPADVPKVIPFPCRKSFTLVPSGTDGWADATTFAILQGEVAVCVADVTNESLELSQGGKSISPVKKNLVIHLQVALIGSSQKVDFTSWANASYGDARNKPLLVDNSQHNYKLRAFTTDTQITGRERPKGLYPKLYADDYLVFEQQPPDIEYLRLELPAAAFGGVGHLRFQIPKSMIEQK